MSILDSMRQIRKTGHKLYGISTVVLLLVAFIASLFLSPREVAVGTLLGATIVWWTFVVWYALRAKWYKVASGRNVMSVSVGLASVLSLFSIGVVFGRFAGYEAVWGIVFLVITVGGIHRIYYVEKIQRQVGRLTSELPRRQRSSEDDKESV